MSRETNIGLIGLLERRIEKGKGDVIKLKRARNSLLKIACVPPEILGEIFSWTLVRGDPTSGRNSHFDGFPEGSFNFLLVCYHWFEVASHAPQLWTFWGNTLEEWRKWHRRHPQVTPLDLVLDNNLLCTTFTPTDGTLKDALRDHAARDNIRQVHLLDCNEGPLSSIISLLTPEDEGVKCKSIESIHLRKWPGVHLLDVSDFFARICLPKLRSLIIGGALTLSSWDHLAQQTTLLTTLSLITGKLPQSPPLAASQLFSILISNPGLQVLALACSAVPKVDGDGPTRQVTLRHLKKLYLNGQHHHVFRILDRLSFPRPLDSIKVSAFDCTVEDASQVFRPYLHHYFRPDRGLQDKLNIGACSSHGCLSIHVSTEDEANSLRPFSANFLVHLSEDPPEKVRQNLCHNLITNIPRERAYRFSTDLPPDRLEELLITMPHIETLELSDVALSEGFLQANPVGPCAGTKLLPSLCSLCLKNLTLGDDGWGPLVTYLGHQTSDGKAISLRFDGRVPDMSPEVMRQIEDIVGKISY